MAYFKTYPMQSSAVLRINFEKSRIKTDPEYQRNGEVWTLEKKQLLIDSILNEYDIPKLYFHDLKNQQADAQSIYDYAIIDGRQRLEAIWDFMDDKFALADDFEYMADPSVRAANMKYSSLAQEYPKLRILFDSFYLPIVCIETDDYELIEEMFSRLNEAVPLNAAEKRNSLGGPMAACIRELAGHHFYMRKVRFSNSRYQHRESVARILFIEHSLAYTKKIIDTKKPYLDDMVRKYRVSNSDQLKEIKSSANRILDLLSSAFVDSDPLLRAQSVVPIYYLAMRAAVKHDLVKHFERSALVKFHEVLAKNREVAAIDIASAEFEYLEYDRMSQQGTNDAASIRERTYILCRYLGIKIPQTE